MLEHTIAKTQNTVCSHTTLSNSLKVDDFEKCRFKGWKGNDGYKSQICQQTVLHFASHCFHLLPGFG